MAIPYPKQSYIKRTDALSDADNAFSVYMRALYADNKGDVKCCTCGAIVPWYGTGYAQWGHWIRRRWENVRYDERNGGVQCKMCNEFGDGMEDAMEGYIEYVHGHEVVIDLRLKALEYAKYSGAQLQDMAKEFMDKAIVILASKNLPVPDGMLDSRVP